MTEKKKKPKRGRLVLCICFVLIVAVIMVGIWQKNNLKAIWMAIRENPETIAQKQEEQKERRQEILKQYGIDDISDAEKTKEANESNESEEIIEGTDQSPGTETEEAPGGIDEEAAGRSAASGTSGTNAVQSYISQLYALEDRYLGMLNQVVVQTKSEFWSLPKEQQTDANKQSLAQAKAGQILAAEKQCDAQVEQILSKIQQTLKEQNGDTGLVQQIRAAYEDSKATWKAACLTELYK